MLVLCVSLSVVSGLKLIVVDNKGSPLPNTFVVYDYEGDAFNIATPAHYSKAGAVIRTDVEGRVSIRPSVKFRVPFLQQRPRLRIHAVWSPQTHSRVFLWFDRPENGKVVLNDVTTNRAEWAFSIEQMQDLMIQREEGAVNLPALDAGVSQLTNAMAEDRRQFEAKFRDGLPK